MTISKLIRGVFAPRKKSLGFSEALLNEALAAPGVKGHHRLASGGGADLTPADDVLRKESTSTTGSTANLVPVGSPDLSPEVCHRLKLIHGLKCRYVRLVMATMILSLVSSIALAVTMKFLREKPLGGAGPGGAEAARHAECWRWIKMAHIMYATVLSGLLLIGLRSARNAVLGASLQQLHGFDAFGDQVILCLMMVSFFFSPLHSFFRPPSELRNHSISLHKHYLLMTQLKYPPCSGFPLHGFHLI